MAKSKSLSHRYSDQNDEKDYGGWNMGDNDVAVPSPRDECPSSEKIGALKKLKYDDPTAKYCASRWVNEQLCVMLFYILKFPSSG